MMGAGEQCACFLTESHRHCCSRGALVQHDYHAGVSTLHCWVCQSEDLCEALTLAAL